MVVVDDCGATPLGSRCCAGRLAKKGAANRAAITTAKTKVKMLRTENPLLEGNLTSSIYFALYHVNCKKSMIIGYLSCYFAFVVSRGE